MKYPQHCGRCYLYLVVMMALIILGTIWKAITLQVLVPYIFVSFALQWLRFDHVVGDACLNISLLNNDLEYVFSDQTPLFKMDSQIPRNFAALRGLTTTSIIASHVKRYSNLRSYTILLSQHMNSWDLGLDRSHISRIVVTETPFAKIWDFLICTNTS